MSGSPFSLSLFPESTIPGSLPLSTTPGILPTSAVLTGLSDPLQVNQDAIANRSTNPPFNATSFKTAVTLGTTVDFNGDGKADFLRQEKDLWDDDALHTAQIFISRGDGSFDPYALPEFFALNGDLTNLYLGDFNGDGRTDILRQEKGIWANDASNTANIFFSNGNGTFVQVNLPEAFYLNGDLSNLYLGDFNGDGKTDFLRQEKGVWDDDANNTVNVFLSAGNGSFIQVNLPETFALKGDLTNLYLGDFNGDGRTDFLRQEKGVWDNENINTANVFFSNGNGTFNQVDLPESFDLKGDLTNLYIGDFNGDGRMDFLRQEKGTWDDDASNTVNIFFSNGNGTFTQVDLPENFDLKGDLTNLYLGDFNGDGRTDFLRQEKGIWDDDSSNTANVFLSQGNGNFTKVNIFIPNENYGLKGDLTNLYLADFNGDGKTDFFRQEKDWWDNDKNSTAEVFLAQVSLTGVVSFRRVTLPENDNFLLKGDFTNLYFGQFTGDRTSTTTQRLQGTLGADTFRLNPNAILTVISGNGNVDFGTAKRDVLDLSNILSSSVGLNLWGRNGGQGVTYSPEVGNNRIFDAIDFYDGRRILFEGIDQIRFSDITIDLSVIPNDPLFNQQWNLTMTGVHNAWRFTTGTDKVLIGIQDSGIARNGNGASHPDLRGFIYWYWTSTQLDNYPDDGTDSHGTPVQGVISATANNQQGSTGINWNSPVTLIDVFGEDTGDRDLADATQTLINGATNGGQRLVINFSLTAPISSSFEQLIANNQTNVLFVISAGNEGQSGSGIASPAILAQKYGNVVAVGASWGRTDAYGNTRNPGDRIAYFDGWASQYSDGLTLMAPSEVVSTSATRSSTNSAWTFDYNTGFNGTSASAPHVTGIASLVWSANPNLTATQVKSLLAGTAVDLGIPGYDIYTGHGLVNADAAVRRALALA